MIASLATAALFLIGGVLLRPRPDPGAVHASGTVVAVADGYAYGSPNRYLTIEFTDQHGHAHRFQPHGGGSFRARTGMPVAVRYRPEAPATTAQRTDGLDGRAHLLCGALGLFALLAGIAEGLL